MAGRDGRAAQPGTRRTGGGFHPGESTRHPSEQLILRGLPPTNPSGLDVDEQGEWREVATGETPGVPAA